MSLILAGGSLESRALIVVSRILGVGYKCLVCGNNSSLVSIALICLVSGESILVRLNLGSVISVLNLVGEVVVGTVESLSCRSIVLSLGGKSLLLVFVCGLLGCLVLSSGILSCLCGGLSGFKNLYLVVNSICLSGLDNGSGNCLLSGLSSLLCSLKLCLCRIKNLLCSFLISFLSSIILCLCIGNSLVCLGYLVVCILKCLFLLFKVSLVGCIILYEIKSGVKSLVGYNVLSSNRIIICLLSGVKYSSSSLGSFLCILVLLLSALIVLTVAVAILVRGP